MCTRSVWKDVTKLVTTISVSIRKRIKEKLSKLPQRCEIRLEDLRLGLRVNLAEAITVIAIKTAGGSFMQMILTYREKKNETYNKVSPVSYLESHIQQCSRGFESGNKRAVLRRFTSDLESGKKKSICDRISHAMRAYVMSYNKMPGREDFS